MGSNAISVTREGSQTSAAQGLAIVRVAIGAMLVLAEVVILFSGVVSRYVFDSPIFWTDELANFLFLWLSMIGTVVALRGNGHTRLTTLVNWVRPGLGKWFNSVAALVVIAFVVEILLPAYEYARDQQFTELTTLGISEGLNYVPIAVSGALILLFSIEHIIAQLRGEDVAPAWH